MTSSKKDGSISMPTEQRKGKVKLTYVGYETLELEYAFDTKLFEQLISF